LTDQNLPLTRPWNKTFELVEEEEESVAETSWVPTNSVAHHSSEQHSSKSSRKRREIKHDEKNNQNFIELKFGDHSIPLKKVMSTAHTFAGKKLFQNMFEVTNLKLVTELKLFRFKNNLRGMDISKIF
jgi:hypothetical protein